MRHRMTRHPNIVINGGMRNAINQHREQETTPSRFHHRQDNNNTHLFKRATASDRTHPVVSYTRDPKPTVHGERHHIQQPPGKNPTFWSNRKSGVIVSSTRSSARVMGCTLAASSTRGNWCTRRCNVLPILGSFTSSPRSAGLRS